MTIEFVLTIIFKVKMVFILFEESIISFHYRLIFKTVTLLQKIVYYISINQLENNIQFSY